MSSFIIKQEHYRTFAGFKNKLEELKRTLKNAEKSFFIEEDEEMLRRNIADAIKKNELDSFIERNFNENIRKILRYINEEIAPYFFKLHLYKAIIATKEFNDKVFFEYLENLDYSKFIEVTLDQNNEIKVAFNEEYLDLSKYEEAVQNTRRDLDIGKMPPEYASEKWSLYYGAAREGLRIFKKYKKNNKIKDITKKFKEGYYAVIRNRLNYFNDSIPFFDILQEGSANITFSVTRGQGSYPTPAYDGYDLVGEITQSIIDEIPKLKKEYVDYIYENFPEVDIEMDVDELTEEDIKEMFMDYLEKEIIPEKRKRLLNFKKMPINSVINSVKNYFQKLGYTKVKVEIYKTKAENFSIRARMPDGKFAKWRVIE